MTEEFTFTANGEAGPFVGPADIFLGASENLGNGALTVMMDGGRSRVTGPDVPVDSEVKIKSRCSFWIVMSGATNPDATGLVIPWSWKTT